MERIRDGGQGRMARRVVRRWVDRAGQHSGWCLGVVWEMEMVVVGVMGVVRWEGVGMGLYMDVRMAVVRTRY